MSKEQGFSIDTDGIKHRLLAERSQLLSKASPALNNPLSQDERDSDEADAAVSTDFRERAMWLAQDQRQKLELIDQALQRIANGSYGHCQTCGGAISPERLEALPYATQCIRCQERVESHGRRGGRERSAVDG